MRFRKLRIAFSVTCLIACVLLIALWVRSYWWDDLVSKYRFGQIIAIESTCGRLGFICAEAPDLGSLPLSVTSVHVGEMGGFWSEIPEELRLTFGFGYTHPDSQSDI